MKSRGLLFGYLAAAGMLGAISPTMGDAIDIIDQSRSVEPKPVDPQPTKRQIVARRRFNGNRYMPHIGTKERARHAGKPDGPMHGLPSLFRAQP